MIKLYDHGIYLINGSQIADSLAQAEAMTGRPVDRAEAEQGTMAYGILREHNVSGSMDQLRLRYDSMASHDIMESPLPKSAPMRFSEIWINML